jgi:hypothetical protein
LLGGADGGTNYANKAVFQAAWRPNLSPVTRKDTDEGGRLTPFDPARLERIKADARNPNAPGVLEYWLKWFDTNPSLRYISDGNPNIVAVPATRKNTVDAARISAQGKILHIYGEASSTGSKSGGSSLGVE